MLLMDFHLCAIVYLRWINGILKSKEMNHGKNAKLKRRFERQCPRNLPHIWESVDVIRFGCSCTGQFLLRYSNLGITWILSSLQSTHRKIEWKKKNTKEFNERVLSEIQKAIHNTLGRCAPPYAAVYLSFILLKMCCWL